MEINSGNFFQLLPLVISLISSFAIWVYADSRAKTTIEYLKQNLPVLDAAQEKIKHSVTELEIKNARLEQDRLEIHRMMDRLENTKASKEVVEGFKSEIANLRIDMDKRFDKIERLLVEKRG